jgi:hypothetical protein
MLRLTWSGAFTPLPIWQKVDGPCGSDALFRHDFPYIRSKSLLGPSHTQGMPISVSAA